MNNLKCSICGVEISSMKNLTKSFHSYICKCGNDVTNQKLEQLIQRIKDSKNDS